MNPQNLENISNFEDWGLTLLFINKNKCIAKLWEKHLKKKIRKGPASYLKSHSDGTILSFYLRKSITWFLRKRGIDSKWVIPNNKWIKKISELLHTAPLTILNFLLTIKASYFLFFTYVKSSRSTMTWKENLPQINKFFSFSFLSTSPGIRMPKWVHVWRQLDNEVSTWFP